MEKGADVDSKDQRDQTPPLLVAANGYEVVVRLLIERADVEGKDKNDRTPLWCAIKNRHEAVVQLLLAVGANVESKSMIGRR